MVSRSAADSAHGRGAMRSKREKIGNAARHLGWPEWKVAEEIDCGCKFTSIAGGLAVRYRQGRFAEFGSHGFAIFRVEISGRKFWQTSASGATFGSIEEAAEHCAHVARRKGGA
jgi:hypothetical protein